MQDLASEVLHNLQFQHGWSELRIATTSPSTTEPLSRLLVVGRPPRRIYVHPDDQIIELKQGLTEDSRPIDREWVLPTRLKEKWSLRKFAAVFDAIEAVPHTLTGESARSGQLERVKDNTVNVKPTLDEASGKENPASRVTKRLLLAVVGDDSTIAYYIVHDGLVKPRQN